MLVTCFPVIREATQIIKKVKKICVKEGFNLKKLTNNKPKVCDAIPEQHREKNVKDRDFSLGSLPEDKALEVK